MSNPGLIERARQMLNAASHGSAGEGPARDPNSKNTNGRAANHTAKGNPNAIWMETEASVTECECASVERNGFRPGGAIEANKFLVSFTYYAHARTYYDRFTSMEARARGERFSLFYNAFDPKQNTTSASEPESGIALTAIGVAVCIFISIMFLVMTHP